MSTAHKEKNVAHQDEPVHTQDYSSNPFEGKVVSITGNTLVMSNKQGKECYHTLATDAKITSDGAACKACHLLAGSKVRVTTENDDRNVVICIEALDKHTEFAECST
jgi:hypothetical protein